MAPVTRSLQERLRSRSYKDSNGCILWLGTTTKSGHGLIHFKGQKLLGTHVAAWFIKTGVLPDKDEQICHKCDIPNCINPEHLYLGDKTTNNHDALERNPGLGTIKLPWAQVEEIRSLGGSYSQRELARRFGVSQSTISRTLNYKRRSIISAK